MDFEICYETRVVIMVDQIPVDFIDIESLKRNKQASGRLQDLGQTWRTSNRRDQGFALGTTLRIRGRWNLPYGINRGYVR